MPAEVGVARWPAQARAAAALVELDMLPLPDASIDRALVVHGLETAEHPSGVLEEVGRVLAPGGRAMFVVPSRRGVWARVDGNPFGQGQPYSRTQLRDLMREALFSPIFWGEALYAPPFRRRFFLNSAPAIERIGAAMGLPFAGVLIVEATKQLYRPVGVRRLGAARGDGAAARPGAGRPLTGEPRQPLSGRNADARFLRLSKAADRALNPAPRLGEMYSCRNRNVCSCCCATAKASGTSRICSPAGRTPIYAARRRGGEERRTAAEGAGPAVRRRFTSALTRAQHTLALTLAELGQTGLPSRATRRSTSATTATCAGSTRTTRARSGARSRSICGGAAMTCRRPAARA